MYIMCLKIFIWLHWILVVAHGILFPDQGLKETRPPALGMQSQSQDHQRSPHLPIFKLSYLSLVVELSEFLYSLNTGLSSNM